MSMDFARHEPPRAGGTPPARGRSTTKLFLVRGLNCLGPMVWYGMVGEGTGSEGKIP